MFDRVLVAIVTAKYLELSALSEQRNLDIQECNQYYHCLVILENEDAVPGVNTEKVKQWRELLDAKTNPATTNNIIKIEAPYVGHLIGEIPPVGVPIVATLQEFSKDIPDIVA